MASTHGRHAEKKRRGNASMVRRHDCREKQLCVYECSKQSMEKYSSVQQCRGEMGYCPGRESWARGVPAEWVLELEPRVM